MKNTLHLITLAAVGLFVLPAIGHAQATDGAFINGNLGSASLDRGPIDDVDTSYGVSVGYRWAVSPRALIGFEAGYVDLGKYAGPISISISGLPPIGTLPTEPEIYPGIVSTEMNGWKVGANGRFNLSPNWYIGGRAGFLRASVDWRVRVNKPDDSFELNHYDFNENGWYVGAGFGYDFSNNFSLGVNYDYYSAEINGSKINPDVVSVSGEYRF